MSILFEQLLEAPDDSLDESCEKELKEDFWNPGKEFNEFVDLLNTEFDESDWNNWNQEERDNFAKQVAEIYLSINPTPTPMFFEDLTEIIISILIEELLENC